MWTKAKARAVETALALGLVRHSDRAHSLLHVRWVCQPHIVILADVIVRTQLERDFARLR